MRSEVDVVLPCLDEAASLPRLLSSMLAGYRPIVADNGSADGSAELARQLGARVVEVPQRGFGAAAHAGLLAATTAVVAFMDADGSLDPRQLPRVCDPVLSERADLVLGRRPTQRGAWSVHAQLGNALVARRFRARTGVTVHDIGPMRAARRLELIALDLRDRRFGYPLEMLVAAAAAGWRIEEVDTDYAPRTAGARSKVTGTLAGTLRTARDMSRVLLP